MKLFVDKVSSYEGVETPQVVNENEDGGPVEAPSINDEIQFDPKAFMENISNLLSKFFKNFNESQFCSSCASTFELQTFKRKIPPRIFGPQIFRFIAIVSLSI